MMRIYTLKGDVQVTPGWRKFEKPTSGDKLLPKLNKGDAVNINFKTVGKMTTPPKRYTVEALNNWMVAPMRGAEKANEEYSDEEWKENPCQMLRFAPRRPAPIPLTDA